MDTAAASISAKFLEVKTALATRNAVLDELYDRYTGDIHASTEAKEAGGIQVVLNQLSTDVIKHVGLMALCPDIQVPPPDETAAGRKRADRIEKLLYALWEANHMAVQQLFVGFFLSCMGSVFIKVFPDPTVDHKITMLVCDPRECYPVLASTGFLQLRQMFHEHQVAGDELKELYPAAKTLSDDDTYSVIEYWDAKSYAVICQDRTLKETKHDFGLPWSFAQNLPLPGLPHGLSDIEQSVGLDDYANDLFRYFADILEFSANPPVVITGARMGSEEWPGGPGGKIHLDPGGSAAFLQWQGQPPSVENQLARALAAIHDGTGAVEQVFGRSQGPAKSGAAITRLLTASMGPRTMIKQINAGSALEEADSNALRMYESLYRDHAVSFVARRRRSEFTLSIKGSEIDGWYKNYIIYPPSIFDYPSRVAIELQLAGAGVQSKYTTRENLGVRSPDDEAKRIAQEARADLELQLELQGTLQNRMPGEIRREASQIEKGGLPQRMQASRRLRQLPPAQGTGRGEPPPEERATDTASSAAGSQGGGGGTLYLSDLAPHFARIANLRGQAFLIGGIVTEGKTDRDIDILLTDRSDMPKIRRILSAALGKENIRRVHFGRTTATPTSPHIALGGVTPGGGLKPAGVRPFSLVPVAKPEKKALTTNEAYSVKALQEKLPPNHTWDVSAKEDGIRCQLHRVGSRLMFLSDEAHAIPLAKLGPVVRAAHGSLPDRCILDGELLLFLHGKNQHHEGLVRYLRSHATDPRETAGIKYAVWDILWNGNDLTSRPFAERSKILGDSLRGAIFRASHVAADTPAIPAAIRKVKSPEGAVIRAMDAAYWATHLLFKYKLMHDVDVTIVKILPTKGGAERYVCADRDGNIVGTTYVASYLKGQVKVGTVITVNVQKVARYVDPKTGKERFHWFSPSPAPPGTRGLKRPAADPQSVFKEIWQETRGGYLRKGLAGESNAK